MAAPLGAEIRCGDVRTLAGADFEAIYRAALEHLVVVILSRSIRARGG